MRLGRSEITIDTRKKQGAGGRMGVGIGVFDAVRRGGKRESTEDQLMRVREPGPFLFDDEVATVAVTAGGEDEDGLGGDGCGLGGMRRTEIEIGALDRGGWGEGQFDDASGVGRGKGGFGWFVGVKEGGLEEERKEQ